MVLSWQNLRVSAYAADESNIPCRISFVYTLSLHTKTSPFQRNVRLDRASSPSYAQYAAWHFLLMHSQRLYSSTVSTGLSTVFPSKTPVKSRISSELSTLSTAYPQHLSDMLSYVDIHVDIHRCIFPSHFRCIFVYIYSCSCMFGPVVLSHPGAGNTRFHSPENFRP